MHAKSERNWGVWATVVGSVAFLLWATLYMGGLFDGGASLPTAEPPAIVTPTK